MRNDIGIGAAAFWNFAGKVVMVGGAIWTLYIIRDMIVINLS